MIDRGRRRLAVVAPVVAVAVLAAACSRPVDGTAVAGELVPELSGPAEPTASSPSAAPAQTGAPDPADLDPLVGRWSGEYTCLQGETGVRMTIAPADDASVLVVLEFFPVPENPSAKRGSFQLVGAYDGDRLLLRQRTWIDKPAGYSMVDFEVTSPVEPEVAALSGNVLFDGCRGFSVRRE